MKDGGCQQLHAVSLKFIGYITDRTIQILAEFCPQLTWLEVLHCPLVSHAVLRKLSCQRPEVMLLTDIGHNTAIYPTNQFTRNQI